MKRVVGTVIGTCLLLVACGQPEEVPEKIDYRTFDIAQIEELIKSGQTDKAIEVIRARKQLNIATKEDYLLAADIYLSAFNGVAAEVMLDKAIDLGVGKSKIVLPRARALLLQGKFEESERFLNSAHLKNAKLTRVNSLEERLLLGDIKHEQKKLNNAQLAEVSSLEELLLRGDIQYGQEKYGEAELFYQKAISKHPDDYVAYTGLTQLKLNQGKLSEAEKYATTAYALEKENPITLYQLGTVKRHLLQNKQATQYLEQAIKYENGHYLARLELTAIHISNNNFEEAQKQLDEVYAIAPGNPVADFYVALLLVNEGKDKEASDLLLRSADLIEDYPFAVRSYGLIAYRLEKYTIAQKYLEKSFNFFQNDRVTAMALADCYLKVGNAQQSFKILDAVLKINPADLEANLQAIKAGYFINDMKMVEHYVNKSLEYVDPNNLEHKRLNQILQYHLSVNQFQSGDEDKAIEQLEKAYSQDSSDYLTQVLLVNLYIKNGNLKKAKEVTDKFLIAHPQNTVILTLKGIILYLSRNLEAALEHYNQAIEASPEYFPAYKNRGLLFLVQKQFGVASDDLKKVVEVTPTDAQARSWYARALLETGNAQESVKHFQIAEKAIPNSAILHADYAEALAELGHYASAVKRAERALVHAQTNEKLVTYIDNLLIDWKSVLTEEKNEKEQIKELELIKLKNERKLQEELKNSQQQETQPPELPALPSP